MNNPLLKEHFPNAKFIESENIDIVDDMIELDKKFHIQIFEYGDGYALGWDNDNNLYSCDFKTFNSAVKKASELKGFYRKGNK